MTHEQIQINKSLNPSITPAVQMYARSALQHHLVKNNILIKWSLLTLRVFSADKRTAKGILELHLTAES